MLSGAIWYYLVTMILDKYSESFYLIAYNCIGDLAMDILSDLYKHKIAAYASKHDKYSMDHLWSIWVKVR